MQHPGEEREGEGSGEESTVSRYTVNPDYASTPQHAGCTSLSVSMKIACSSSSSSSILYLPSDSRVALYIF